MAYDKEMGMLQPLDTNIKRWYLSRSVEGEIVRNAVPDMRDRATVQIRGFAIEMNHYQSWLHLTLTTSSSAPIVIKQGSLFEIPFNIGLSFSPSFNNVHGSTNFEMDDSISGVVTTHIVGWYRSALSEGHPETMYPLQILFDTDQSITVTGVLTVEITGLIQTDKLTTDYGWIASQNEETVVVPGSIKIAVDQILSSMFPVGSVQLSHDGPPNLPGTWELLTGADGRYIQLSSVAGETKEAGLPNITGDIGQTPDPDSSEAVGIPIMSAGARGALSYQRMNARSQAFTPANTTGGVTYALTFDASYSNDIYGKSNTVTPATYTLKAYIRTV